MTHWRDQTTPAIVCGRKFCSHKDHAGRRWLPLLYFGVSKWRPAPLLPHLQRYCEACARREYARWASANKEKLAAKRRAERRILICKRCGVDLVKPARPRLCGFCSEENTEP